MTTGEARVVPFVERPIQRGQWIEDEPMEMFLHRLRQGDSELEALDYLNELFDSRVTAEQLEMTKRLNVSFARAIVSAIHHSLKDIESDVRKRVKRSTTNLELKMKWLQIQYARQDRILDRILKAEGMQSSGGGIDPFRAAAAAQLRMGYDVDGGPSQKEIEGGGHGGAGSS